MLGIVTRNNPSFVIETSPHYDDPRPNHDDRGWKMTTGFKWQKDRREKSSKSLKSVLKALLERVAVRKL